MRRAVQVLAILLGLGAVALAAESAAPLELQYGGMSCPDSP